MLSGISGGASALNIRVSTSGVNTAIQSGFITELQDTQQQAINSLNQLQTTLLANLQTLCDQCLASIDVACQDCKDELQALKDQYQVDLQNVTNAGITALNTLVTNLQTQLNTDFQNYTNQLNAIVTQFNTDVQNLLQSLQTQLLNDLNSHLATLTALASSLETQIQTFAQNEQTQIETYLTNLQSTIETSITNLGTQLLADLQAQYDQHETDLNSIVSAFNTTATNYDALFQLYLSQAQQLLNDTVQAAQYETMPIGTVVSFYSLTLPTNYLVCDGSVYDTVTYPDLFAVLGVNTTPDLRGVFIRGWDPQAINDPQGAARQFGSFQQDDVEAHSHSGSTDISGGVSNANISGNTSSDPVTLRISTGDGQSTNTVKTGFAPGSQNFLHTTAVHSHTFNGTINLPDHSHTFTTDVNASSGETRPKNVTMIFMIKAI